MEAGNLGQLLDGSPRGWCEDGLQFRAGTGNRGEHDKNSKQKRPSCTAAGEERRQGHTPRGFKSSALLRSFSVIPRPSTKAAMHQSMVVAVPWGTKKEKDCPKFKSVKDSGGWAYVGRWRQRQKSRLVPGLTLSRRAQTFIQMYWGQVAWQRRAESRFFCFTIKRSVHVADTWATNKQPCDNLNSFSLQQMLQKHIHFRIQQQFREDF